MMSNEEVRGRAVWRRAIVPIAATAATVIGGMVIATPAHAAGEAATATFVNGATNVSTVSIRNDASVAVTSTFTADFGDGTVSGNEAAFLDFAVPTNLPCANITLTSGATATDLAFPANPSNVGTPASGQASTGLCRAVATTNGALGAIAASTTYNGPTAVAINGTVTSPGNPSYAVTGDVTATLTLYRDKNNGSTKLAASSPITAHLVNPVYPATVTVSANKTSLVNDGTDTATLAPKLPWVDPLAGAASDAAAKLSWRFTFPAGVTGSDVTFTGLTGAACVDNVCTGTTAAPLPGTKDADGNVSGLTAPTVAVKTANSGNITIKADLVDGKNTVRASGTTTVALAGPTAPSFNAAPPAATIYQPYSYQLVNNAGTNTTPTTYLAVCVAPDTTPGAPAGQKTVTWKDSTGAANTSRSLVTPSTAGTSAAHNTITLDAGFSLDLFTGKIVASPSPMQAQANPACTWTVVANNGTGGASADVAQNTNAGTPEVKKNDVSVTFSLPVLFSDTPANSTFGAQIYALAAMPFNGNTGALGAADWAKGGVIGGYADGTFRGSLSVTRQAFAHFLAGLLNNQQGTAGTVPFPTGACTVADPSAFNDVPNTSTFCQDIKSLALAGIINGYSDGGFHPGALISRQAMSAFVYRTDAVKRGVPTSTIADAVCTQPIPFNDFDASNQFCGDIEWMATNKITTGYADGGFHPLGNSSRQATAAFLGRLWSMWHPA